MKILYQITPNYITKLYRGVDYVENYNKITFCNNGTILKSDLDKILEHEKYNFIIYTYNKDMIHKYQKKIKRLKGA